MASGAEIIARHRRLCILKLLEKDPDYSLNESILHDLVGEFGLQASRDVLRGDLAWLAEQGLAEISDVHGLQVATLTQRGADVAHGLATHPGVKRPSPK